MEGLTQYADRAANLTLRDDEIRAIVDELFPITDKTGEREKANLKKCRDEFMICYFAPDIAKFRNTAWGVINAASDLVTHSMPHRNTSTYAENNWGRIMDGHVLMDKAAMLAMKGAA